jgi:4-hydroxybenzoate polyprenyltransferase
MYSVNNYLDKNFLVKTNSYKYKIYKQYGRILLFVSIIFFIMSLIISYTIDPILLLLIGVPYFLGIIYSTPFCRNIIQKFSPAMIKKVYNTKIVTAFGWLVPLILIPYFDRDVPGFKILSISMFYFSFVFLRQILIDLVAFQGDLILGRETLPTWIGIKNASAAAYILSGISGGLFAASIIYYGMFNYFILLIPLICYIVLLKKIGKTDYLISLRYEFIIDANLIFFIITFLL